MDLVAVSERVLRIDAACGAADADVREVEAALVAARELTGWVEARRATLIGRLSAVSSFPEATIAEADRSSLTAASRVKERADTLSATPRLAATLGAGQTTPGHIDVVTRAARRLGDRGAELLVRVDTLAAVAGASTVEQFARRVDLEAKRLETDDGEDRLERQRQATRMRSWVDDDGMWNIKGRFDPVTGVRLDARLHATVEALFTDATPQQCPVDPIDKQQFLLAHAFASLIDGTNMAARPGRPEFVVVIDADADPAAAGVGPVAQWPIPVEIPTRVLADLAGDADIHTVVVRNGVVLHAPGALDLGRTTRFANRAQRRALRGLYRGCCIPGCSVGYDRCKLHHVIWWRHGGRTDLDNLIPICSHHHGNIHNDGWIIELGPHRQLTLRLPDGNVRNTGPPNRRTAA